MLRTRALGRLALALSVAATTLPAGRTLAQSAPPPTPPPAASAPEVPDVLGAARACYAGEHARCVVAGDGYRDGSTVDASPALASTYYRFGCDHDQAACCHRLGLLALEGNGVPQSGPEGVRLLTRACDAGLGEACFDLANALWTGDGMPEDHDAGGRFYTRACELGHGPGCREEAYIYGRALGVSRDYTRMIELLRRACELGEQESCREVADPVSAVARVEGESTAEATGMSAPAMAESSFREILGRFRSARTAPAQVALARELAEAGARMSCAQIAQIMRSLARDSVRIDVARELWRRSVDPQRFSQLLEALDHEGSRTLLSQQTGH